MSVSTLWRQTAAIVRKDLRRELRTREVTTTTVAFSVLLMVIFAFGFYRRGEAAAHIFPGALWISILFAGTLAIGRTFQDERDSGCLRALALIPGTRLSLYLGKLLINLSFMFIFELALVPLLLLAFDVPIAGQLPTLALTIGAGTLGFSALGTLVAAMLVHHRLREVLLPLLLYPLLVPLLIGGVRVVVLLLQAPTSTEITTWLQVMLAMDLAFMLGGLALFQWVLEAIE